VRHAADRTLLPPCLLSKPGDWSPPKSLGLEPTPPSNPSRGELRLRTSSVQFPACLISLPPHWCYRLPSLSPTTTGAVVEAETSSFFRRRATLPLPRSYGEFRHPPCCPMPPPSPPLMLRGKTLPSASHRSTAGEAATAQSSAQIGRGDGVVSAHPGAVPWADFSAGPGHGREAVGQKRPMHCPPPPLPIFFSELNFQKIIQGSNIPRK
jgi:hypothetical protein